MICSRVLVDLFVRFAPVIFFSASLTRLPTVSAIFASFFFFIVADSLLCTVVSLHA